MNVMNVKLAGSTQFVICLVNLCFFIFDLPEAIRTLEAIYSSYHDESFALAPELLSVPANFTAHPRAWRECSLPMSLALGQESL